MSKKIITLLLLSFIFTACVGYYKITKDANGEPVVNDKVKYTFTKVPTPQELSVIDTSAYYVQVFEERYYNSREMEIKEALQFHSDGFFKKVYFNDSFQSKERNKNSLHYGGKYRITGNYLELEVFYPAEGGSTKYYVRRIRKAKINGDRIVIDDDVSILSIFEKRDSLAF